MEKINQDTLIFIDSYLSDLERADACTNLIAQIRLACPEYKIALLNKYPDSWKLDTLVDYYFYYGDSIMVGEPPQHLLDSEKYERAYVYMTTSLGTCENWLPLTGVTDHVASIYNGFILSARIAKSLGFKKVFKVEYDTDFDIEELKSIKIDFPIFKDYLLHGKRQEGEYAKEWHYLTDVHTIGYSVDLFDGFDFTLTDESWWNLCEKLNYYGKWIEYIIPSIIEYQRRTKELDGIVYNGESKDNFPNTNFDIINSPSYWTEKWEDMPKICKVNFDKNSVTNQIVLFYWNEQDTDLEIKCNVTNSKGEILYNKEVILSPRAWIIDNIPLKEELHIENINTRKGNTRKANFTYSPNTIKNTPVRFKYESKS